MLTYYVINDGSFKGQPLSYNLLPSQNNASGYFLATNGSSVLWLPAVASESSGSFTFDQICGITFCLGAFQ